MAWTRPNRRAPPERRSAVAAVLPGASPEGLSAEGAGPASADRGSGNAGSPARALPWVSLFEQFFSPDPDQATAATATFARMIRFWAVRVGFRDDASCSTDDLVQDVLLELARSRDDIADPRALGGWLRTTTVRKASDRWRTAQRAPRWPSRAECLEDLPAVALLPDDEVMLKQDRSDLRNAIAHLPPLLRTCVELQLRGLSEAEIALQLQADDVTTATAQPVRRHSVKNWLRKARGVLRDALLEKQS